MTLTKLAWAVAARICPMPAGLLPVGLLMAGLAVVLALAAPVRAHDRHAGYYYPEPAAVETYQARAVTLADATRDTRLSFVIRIAQQMLKNPYPPQSAMFAKGDEAQKLIIVGLRDGYLNTIYRARAHFAMLTSVARATKYLNDLGVADFFTFFDLAKLLGFEQITITDGDKFAHQVLLK